MILSYLIVDILCILMIDGLVYELVNDGKDHCFDEKFFKLTNFSCSCHKHQYDCMYLIHNANNQYPDSMVEFKWILWHEHEQIFRHLPTRKQAIFSIYYSRPVNTTQKPCLSIKNWKEIIFYPLWLKEVERWWSFKHQFET